MKAALLLPAILFAAAFLPAAQVRADLPFQPGDRFAYSLHWSFIKVGEAVLEFEKSALEEGGTEYLHAVFIVETSGIADKLFKVRDRIESWIEFDTGRPVFYKKKQREGKTKRDIELQFDWNTMEARYFRDGTERDPIELTEKTYDPLSLILAVSDTSFSVGESHSFATSDGKEVVQIEVTHKKDRRIKTRAGRFESHHLDVATKELEGVFDKSPDASIELWLSKDAPSIPLKMKSEVIVGSFHGQLVEASRDNKSIL